MPQKIMEIKNFREALNEIYHDTWLILDLDNTVMTSVLGDAWFNGLFGHLLQKKIDKQTALPWILSVYNEVQHFARTTAVEGEAILLIKAFQDIGIPVIGLTARGSAIRQQTVRQLIEMGVDLSRNSIVKNDANSCLGGIIFCDGKDKGEQLKLFFAKQGKLPGHITMLDDREVHLKNTMAALAPLGISFSGFRYGYLDEEVKKFNMEQANVILAHLWNWLSPAVQKDINNLQLIQPHIQGVLCPSKHAVHFFHPDHPLHPIATPINPPKLVRRSMSPPNSSISKKNQESLTMLEYLQRIFPITFKRFPKLFTQLTPEAQASLAQLVTQFNQNGLGAFADQGLLHATTLFNLSSFKSSKEHFQLFRVAIMVLANPLCQTIFEARLRGFSDYSVPSDPLSSKDANSIIQQLYSLKGEENRIRAFFNIFAKLRPFPGSQKYIVELDVAGFVTRDLSHYCNSKIKRITSHQDYLQVQEMINTLKKKGGDRTHFEAIKYSIANSIESEDMCSMRSYDDLMREVWTELNKPQVNLAVDLEPVSYYTFTANKKPQKDHEATTSKSKVPDQMRRKRKLDSDDPNLATQPANARDLRRATHTNIATASAVPTSMKPPAITLFAKSIEREKEKPTAPAKRGLREGVYVDELELTQAGMHALFAHMGYPNITSGSIYNGTPTVNVGALNKQGFMPILTGVGSNQIAGHWIMFIRGLKNQYYLFDPLGHSSARGYHEILTLQLPKSAALSVIPNGEGLNRGLCGYWVASSGLRAHAALNQAIPLDLSVLGQTLTNEMRAELANDGYASITHWLSSAAKKFPGAPSNRPIDAKDLRLATKATTQNNKPVAAGLPTAPIESGGEVQILQRHNARIFSPPTINPTTSKNILGNKEALNFNN